MKKHVSLLKIMSMALVILFLLLIVFDRETDASVYAENRAINLTVVLDAGHGGLTNTIH